MSTDTSQESPKEETFEFKAEINRMLDIIINSLYTNREIFLRELISNAADALNKIRFEKLTSKDVYEPDAELSIDLSFNADEDTISISDTGIGMTKDELIDQLGTIASSGSLKFLETIKDKESADFELIGQFGVGFYSVYMVASKVVIRTRSYHSDSTACEWTSEGSGFFTIKEIDKEHRGTDVIIYLKEDAKEFANEFRLEQIVKRYSDYISFPIRLKDKVLNQQTALWRKNPKDVTEEEYEKFYQHVSQMFDKPLHQIHYNIDAPIQFRSLLFIPEKRKRTLFMPELEWGPTLYSRNVLIQEKSKDLLPEYFRFVVGVVDSEDVPLNISRELVQVTRTLTRIRKRLEGKVIRELKALAENDTEKYAQFWKEFGIFIKEGVSSDYSRRPQLMKLLRFKSDKVDEDSLTSLDDYINRMKKDQKEIYYLLGEDIGVLRQSPHLEYYQEQDLEVLLLDDPADTFLMMNIQDYEDKKFVGIDRAADEDKDLEEDEEESEEEKKEEIPIKDEFKPLFEKFKEVLKDRVMDVKPSDRLRGSPCRLVSPAGMGSAYERAFKYMNQDFQFSKKILEINQDHEIVKNLAQLFQKDANHELGMDVIEQLFESALLTEGYHLKPASMVPRIQRIMDRALKEAID
ncbi:MAG: molecular chaperone HtpG [Candidatus Hermodarchaeota archaeon]